MRKIKQNTTYRVKSSETFKKKYGDERPTILIEDRDKIVFGDIWKNRGYVPAVVAFMVRQVKDDLLGLEKERVYYGKIKHIGELVFESELEKI